MSLYKDTKTVTTFQRQCASDVEDLLRSKAMRFTLRQVVGEQETYLLITVNHNDYPGPDRLSIYLYIDEAGFFLGEKWHIWERQDHFTLDDLRNAFVAGVSSALDETTRCAG